MPAVSNNALTAFNPELWRPKMQQTFFKESTALGVVNLDLRAELREGDQLHQPFAGYARVQDYTKGTDIVVKDVDATDDSITVNTTKVASFYVDDIDRVQNKYDAISNFASGAMRQLNNTLDQAVLSEYTNAEKTLDAGDFGGSSGSGLALSLSNVAEIFTAQGRVLNNKKRLGGDRFAMIGPRMLEVIQNYVGARETGFGEVVSDNGVVGRRFGFRLVLSNNLPFTATLDGATQFVDGDTTVINGVTFEADTDGSASGAGRYSRQGDAALCLAQLASAINDDGTPGADEYIALSTEDRQLIEESGIVATVSGTDILLTGFGDIVVSHSGVGSGWSAQLQYSLSGIQGAVALIAQVAPNIEFRKAQLRLGRYVHPWMLFGKGTFERNKGSLVATQMDVSSWA